MRESFKYNFWVCLMVALATTATAQQVSQRQFQIPVLKGKTVNPVLQLVVNSDGQELTAVTVNTSDVLPTDVESLSLFVLHQDSTFVSGDKLQKATVFATTTVDAYGKTTLKGKAKLTSGNHYFWLTVKLKPNADVLHNIAINVASVIIGQKQVVVKSSGQNIAQRIGIALRQHNQDGVHTHRIPGITTAKNGSLLAIYDARYESARDLQGHMDIGLSRSIDQGKTWLPMQIAIDMGTYGGLPQKFNGVSDACILTDKRTGSIYIAGLWMYGLLDDKGKWIEGLTDTSTKWNHQWKARGSQPGFDIKQTAQFLIVKSTDNGKTWSKPINLTKMCKREEWWLWAPAPGSGITLKDGTLVFPTQGRDANGKPFSNLTYSKDSGKTWKTSKAAVTEETTENMAVELSDGAIMLNMRANSNRTNSGSGNGRAIAVTRDLGETWTTHPTSHKALIEPTCMASIIRHDYTLRGYKKSMLIFCNPNAKTLRNHMTIQVSYDDGNTWVKKILLDEQKSRAYSCITSIDPETIGVIYESSQADLVFETIKLKELL